MNSKYSIYSYYVSIEMHDEVSFLEQIIVHPLAFELEAD